MNALSVPKNVILPTTCHNIFVNTMVMAGNCHVVKGNSGPL